MWIYVPLTSSPSVPAAADSISESDWRFQKLEQYAALNTKHPHARYWHRAWKRDSWIRRLFGRIYEPSTANHGVEKFISLLEDIPASHFPTAESERESPIQDTSGQKSRGWSGNVKHPSSSLKTSKGTSASASRKSEMPYSKWVTMLKQDSSTRRKLVLPMSAPGCLSSGPETPGSRTASGNGWPTPSASGSAGEISEDIEKRGKKFYNVKTGRMLQTNLATEAKHWYPSGDQPSGFSLQSRKIPGGGRSYRENLFLNPLFVAWLMNWPMGWTSVGSQIDRAKFECWETESSRRARLTLSAYFSTRWWEGQNPDEPPSMFDMEG